MSNMPKYQYLIEDSNNNFSDALVIALKPKTPKDVFTFKPGQYVMLSFSDANKKLFINHPFSIASSPTDDNLVFGIRVMGKFTQTLSKLPTGTQIDVLGPFGDFVFDEHKYPEAVFIAGGVGITPFISAARYATIKKLKNKLTLLYSSRNVKEALFYEDIKKIIAANPNFSAKLAITNESIPEGILYCENCRISKEFISANIGSLTNKDFFLCGPGAFMKAMEQSLTELGVAKNKIHQEAFSVTPNLSFRKNWPNLALVYGFSLVLFIFSLLYVSGNLKEKDNEGYKAPIKNSSLDLINNIVNNRRDNIIDSKTKLLETIQLASSSTKTQTKVNNIPKIVTPVTTIPKISKPQTVIPAVNTPIYVPTPAPRTRTS
jgi:ferredoxin-NADP reductase